MHREEQDVEEEDRDVMVDAEEQRKVEPLTELVEHEIMHRLVESPELLHSVCAVVGFFDGWPGILAFMMVGRW